MSKRTPGHALWDANDALVRYTSGTWAETSHSIWESLAQAANKASAPDESSTRLANGTGTFGDALVALKAGRRVHRACWEQADILLDGTVLRVLREGDYDVQDAIRSADLLASDWSVLP